MNDAASPGPIRDLGSFLSPLPLAEFRDSFWERKHLATPADSSRLAALEAALPDRLSALVSSHAGPCSAWLETLEGEARSVAVHGRDAVSLYEAGMTIYMTEVSALRPFGEAIARELGVSASRVVCGVFASRRSRGAPCHFDANENFTVQLRGSKRWRIAPNAEVTHPTSNWVAGQTPSAALHAATTRALPETMPAGAEEITLRPGATLYVPRGHWHETMAGEDSLSINVLYKPKTGLDVVLDRLRSALEIDSTWRGRAEGLARETEREGLEGRIDALRELLDALPTRAFTAHDGEGAAAYVEGDALVRNPFALFHVVGGKSGGEGEVRARFETRGVGAIREREVTLDPSYVEATIALARRPLGERFTAFDLRHGSTALDAEEVRALVATWLEVGFVCRARGVTR